MQTADYAGPNKSAVASIVKEVVNSKLEIGNNFNTMFTNEEQQQARREKYQKEIMAKLSQDLPLFTNVRESIKNFTDSI